MALCLSKNGRLPLEGFEVRRALPANERRMVGPFIFFDQMGPASS
jgi:redox-sensitive bicupin YhaK (pirin superfamily)